MTIRITVNKQLDGTTFSLSLSERRKIAAVSSTSIPNQIFIGHDTMVAFEDFHGPVWKQVSLLLTGLSNHQLEQLGGVQFVDHKGQIFHTLPEAA